MISEKSALSIVEDVYRLIEKEFRSGDPLVNHLMNRALAVRGKGMRPRFMHLVARMYGYSWEKVRLAAMVVEAIHIASLLHDDVVDGSKLRRGAATLNSSYSDKVSVLLGDYILLQAFSIANSLNNEEIVSVLRRAVERMIEGEISDSLCPELIDEEKYLTIIGNKTASLFAAAGEVTLILFNGGVEDRLHARELGECVGMAFQIIDDALDYRGDADMMGKPVFMDIRTGCLTLPLIHALRERHPADAKNILKQRVHCTERVLSVIGESGGIDYAIGRAEEYIRKAGEILNTWRPVETPAIFDQYFEALLERGR